MRSLGGKSASRSSPGTTVGTVGKDGLGFGRHIDVLFLFFIRSLLGIMPSSARLGIHLLVAIKNLQLFNTVCIAQVTYVVLFRDALHIETLCLDVGVMLVINCQARDQFSWL